MEAGNTYFTGTLKYIHMLIDLQSQIIIVLHKDLHQPERKHPGFLLLILHTPRYFPHQPTLRDLLCGLLTHLIHESRQRLLALFIEEVIASELHHNPTGLNQLPIIWYQLGRRKQTNNPRHCRTSGYPLDLVPAHSSLQHAFNHELGFG